MWLCFANQSILQSAASLALPAFVSLALVQPLPLLLSLSLALPHSFFIYVSVSRWGFSATWLRYTNFDCHCLAVCLSAACVVSPLLPLLLWLLLLQLLLPLPVVAPKRFAFCLFCVNLKSALVMLLQLYAAAPFPSPSTPPHTSHPFPCPSLCCIYSKALHCGNCWHLQLLGCHGSKLRALSFSLSVCVCGMLHQLELKCRWGIFQLRL